MNFFEPWCQTCRKETVSFDRLGKEWKGQEAVFLQMAVKVKEKELRRIKKEWTSKSMTVLIQHLLASKADR